MNVAEIKIFQSTSESIQFKKMNEDEICPVELYKITAATIDLEAIIAFYPHFRHDNVTSIDFTEGDGFIVPMEYEKFKEFYHRKMVKEKVSE